MCNNSRCIGRENVCDQKCDCLDTCDDEIGCETLECPQAEKYRCRSHKKNERRCISRSARCDGHNDCRDTKLGSDEDWLYCNKTSKCKEAPAMGFRCPEGGCLPDNLTGLSFLCDHANDCQAGDDEDQCNFKDCSADEYRCNNAECLANQHICNGVADCVDGSDERHCLNYTCPHGTRKCASGHCVPRGAWCDHKRDCPDNSDELKCDFPKPCKQDQFTCRNGQCIPKTERCYKDRNHHSGCMDHSHLIDCNKWECPASQYKCLYSYCIPSTHVCDHEPDCLMSYSDELHEKCEFQCPIATGLCRCKDELMTCNDPTIKALPRFQKIDIAKKVVINGLSLGSSLSNQSFIGMERVTALDLSENKVTSLQPGAFHTLFRLKSLVLDDNQLTKIEPKTFMGLASLGTLYLHRNAIRTISPLAFSGLGQLRDLDLSRQNISKVFKDSFYGLKDIRKLNLSGNHITRLDDGTFNSLGNVKKLDIRNNHIEIIEANVFHGLANLSGLYTDEYRFCCIAPHVAICTPAPDEFSSCEDLMSNTILRIMIWIIGFVASFGNIHVIGWRVREINKAKVGKVHSFLITNLAIADFLMGVYLLLIASVDSFYRGSYIVHDKTWRASNLCQDTLVIYRSILGTILLLTPTTRHDSDIDSFYRGSYIIHDKTWRASNFWQLAGFISTLSSELSVFTLTTITVDRLVSIIFPFQIRRMTFRTARITMALMWALVALLAAIPLVGIPYFDSFYGRSPVCLPLHITPQRPKGWEYSVFIFLGCNALSFIIIATSYITMYSTAKKSRSAVRSQEARTDNAMARRMTLIVLTDFLCWVPIIVLGVISLAGASIPPQVYAWIAVFVLPLNSAVNPVLYTLATTPFLSHIQHRASSIRKSWATANGETRESYAGESITWDRDTGRDLIRNKDAMRMRGFKGQSIDRSIKNGRHYQIQSNCPDLKAELKALQEATTDTDSDPGENCPDLKAELKALQEGTTYTASDPMENLV